MHLEVEGGSWTVTRFGADLLFSPDLDSYGLEGAAVVGKGTSRPREDCLRPQAHPGGRAVTPVDPDSVSPTSTRPTVGTKTTLSSICPLSKKWSGALFVGRCPCGALHDSVVDVKGKGPFRLYGPPADDLRRTFRPLYTPRKRHLPWCEGCTCGLKHSDPKGTNDTIPSPRLILGHLLSVTPVGLWAPSS